MLRGFALEKIYASFAQREGDLDTLLLEDEILGCRQKIWDDLGLAQWLIGVLDFRAHRFACPSASIRHR